MKMLLQPGYYQVVITGVLGSLSDTTVLDLQVKDPRGFCETSLIAFTSAPLPRMTQYLLGEAEIGLEWND